VGDRSTRTGSSAYNIPLAEHISGTLNVAALERSFNELVRRHESLRTTFKISAGQPVQVINEPQRLRLEVTDLSRLPEAEREREAARESHEEAQQPFDLVHGPLLRVRLLKLDEEEHLLLLTMHHIVSDGWSMEVFVRELTTLYNAFSENRPSPLAELPLQYVDFALWQREVVERRSARTTACLLEAAVERCVTGVVVAARSPAAAGTHDANFTRGRSHPGRRANRAQADWPAGKRHDVHDPAGRVQDFARASEWTKRHHCWHANRRTQPGRVGKLDRVLCEYAGAAH
jgi:hypothetical protein